MDITPRRHANLRDTTSVLIVVAISALVLHTGWAVYGDQPLLWEHRPGASNGPMASDTGKLEPDEPTAPTAGDGHAVEEDGAHQEGEGREADDSASSGGRPGRDATPKAADVDVELPYDHAAEVDAAIEILTVNDDGTRYETAGRWRQDTVIVTVTGDQATAEVLAEIDDALVWMSETTGLQFIRIDQGGGDIDVTVDSDKLPRARQRLEGDTIFDASATWNTSYGPWRIRWMWEELVHTAGPVGDYGPADTLFNDDMQAGGATDFDRWMIEGLYLADGTSPAQLRAWYEANPRL